MGATIVARPSHTVERVITTRREVVGDQAVRGYNASGSDAMAELLEQRANVTSSKARRPRTASTALSFFMVLATAATPWRTPTLNTGVATLAPTTSAGVPARARFQSAIARIRRFQLLTNGWDGPTSHPPSYAASVTALRVLDIFSAAAPSSATKGPQVAPLAEGGFQFEWRHQGRELYAACENDGRITVLESAVDHERETPSNEAELSASVQWLFAT